MVKRLTAVLIALLLAPLCPLSVAAQTRDVDPSDLKLELLLEELPTTPFRQEMVLLTIHGVYKRHITREKLVQPDLAGFSWMQLGEDYWYESMIDGLPVKNMRRRMALFPDKAGTLEIGRFQHTLTLLDEQNKWFEHTIESAPLTLDVAPEPAREDWWFPVRNLKVSDNWSNPPDQLKEGEGVLRVIRLSALGASPDMLPPMPRLTSPSALIFAHPEKRLVELTPYGPLAIAFWRWTVTPTNGHAAILEPIEFSFFDTLSRQDRTVTISAQRVAFGAAEVAAVTRPLPATRQAQLWPGLNLVLAVLAFAGGVLAVLRQRTVTLAPMMAARHRWQCRTALRRAARQGDGAALRRAARQLDALYKPTPERIALLRDLDSQLFGLTPDRLKMKSFAHKFETCLQTLHPVLHTSDRPTDEAISTR